LLGVASTSHLISNINNNNLLFVALRGVVEKLYETTLVFPIRPSDKILKFSITREYSSFEHQFPGKRTPDLDSAWKFMMNFHKLTKIMNEKNCVPRAVKAQNATPVNIEFRLLGRSGKKNFLKS
jgi:hypothetical protein